MAEVEAKPTEELGSIPEPHAPSLITAILTSSISGAGADYRFCRPVVLEETAAMPPNLFESLDTLLAELERATLDERDVDELERLAAQLEQTARELERVA